jgi:rRNA-processing protein FCF1
MKKLKVIIDTNIWIYAALYKIDIFQELLGYEIFTLSKVIEELKQISKRKSKQAIAARVALSLIERHNVKTIECKASADEELLKLAKEGYIILTQDRELLERIKEVGGKIGYIRQKRYIEFC